MLKVQNCKSSVVISFILLCLVFSSNAQTKKIVIDKGTWSFTQYAHNIIKVSFKPLEKLYHTNENISDAVIARPVRLTMPVEVNGNLAIIGNTKMVIKLPEPDGDFFSFKFGLNDNEKIFGGGERALPLNRRGYKFNLFNNPWYGYSEGADNLNYSVPFFTSSKGYGLFFDNASKGYADIGKTDNSIFEVGFVSGELNVYVIMGKDYKEILAGYHHLTGTQPLPPRWALGNFMSRFGYSSETQVKEIAAKMKAADIPVDAVIFDLFWFGDSIKQTMGNLDWVNKKSWPNPEKMIRDFKKDNIQTILITEPFVLKSSLNYDNSKQYHATDSAGNPFVLTDFYFGNGGIVDIFRKDAQQWFWKQHKKQMKIGVEGWWGDLGEPEKHPAGIYHNLKDQGFNRLFKADEVHNIYGHNWTKMLYNNYAKEYPAKRLFSLNRSGFAGSQRYGIFPWSGDVSRNWSGLRAQLPIMLSMSMSGVPYIHADAGGFAGGEGDNELYVRWLQFAAFTPVFRPHGTALDAIDKNAFSFPSEAALIAQPFQGYAKDAIYLRYAMLPYNYTLAAKQAADGAPLVAPLYYYYPADTTAVNVGDEFFWGENLLIAPVLQKEAATRSVYLPKGNWYDFSTNHIIEGNKWILENTNIHQIPVYAKAGSFIPMWHPQSGKYQSTADYTATKDIDIIYYPSAAKSTGSIYNDDGKTKHPVSETIQLTAMPVGNKITISISSTNEMLYKNGLNRKLTIAVPAEFVRKNITVTDGGKLIQKQAVDKIFKSSETSSFTCIEVNFTGKPVKIEYLLKR